LPPAATTSLVWQRAKEAGVQVRGVEVRRESVETAFLRVIGEQPAIVPPAPQPGTYVPPGGAA
jgi:hypothetical protein